LSTAVAKIVALSVPVSDVEHDVGSFEEIYARWFHEVSRWVRALGGLDADLDDLTQDVFMVVRRKLATFDGRNLQGWLYTIAKHQVSDYRRRAWVRRLLRGIDQEKDEMGSFVLSSSDPCEELQKREVERFLAHTLRKMTESQKTAFVLFEIEGFSGEEIATLEGIPVNTVWTRLHYARKRFFELVEEARVEGRLP
jgi:RNA polymerase sigma-70 factor, ECF subfamily